MDSIKIVLISNKNNQSTIFKINSALKKLNKNINVKIIESSDSDLIIKFFDFIPAVVFIDYCDLKSMINDFYILKYLLKFSLISFKSESIFISRNNISYLSILKGKVNYGNNFIDHEIFCSKNSTKLIGEILLKKNMISSQQRIHFMGTPVFEDYIHEEKNEINLPECIDQKIKSFSKIKTLLIVTRFQYAEFDENDIIDFIDQKGNNDDYNSCLTLIEKSKIFRNMWIRSILVCAQQNPGLLFIVKIHPIEIDFLNKKNQNPYDILNQFNNVLLIKEPVSLKQIIKNSSLLLHYGSTAMIEAYLSQIPSIYIDSKDLKKIHSIFDPFVELEIPSTLQADILDLQKIILSFANNHIKFQRNQAVESYLKEQIALTLHKHYKPSERIANFLLSVSNEKPQSISDEDKYLHKYIMSENKGKLLTEMLCKKGYDLVRIRNLNTIETENYKNALQKYLGPAEILAKRINVNVLNLQYLRSICLVNINLFELAIKALEEELKSFPDNTYAKELYNILISISKNKSPDKPFGKRKPYSFNLSNIDRTFELANILLKMGDFNRYADLYEQLIVKYHENPDNFLANLYEQYEILEKQNADRFILYQSRFFNFDIKPGDKVLDVGSGNIPFRYANFLADFAIDDNEHGRAGMSFKKFQGIPAVQCNIENLPFKDKEIDFVYCSHVLEHSDNPEDACKELIRIGKRGFIEVPSRAKDMVLSTAKASNHRWAIELFENSLIFMEYTEDELEALKCDLLLNMHGHPQTVREKAFSALLYLRANIFNVMMLWEDTFDYKIFRLSKGLS